MIIGGADGGYLRDYNDTWIPQNIVRLVKDDNGIYQIDTTFTTRNWDDNGGFNNAVLSISLLPNGKYMVGGQFGFYGDNNILNDISYLVRLNSDGTLVNVNEMVKAIQNFAGEKNFTATGTDTYSITVANTNLLPKTLLS